MKTGAIGQDKGAKPPTCFTIKNFKSHPSTVLSIARLQWVHDTINQTEMSDKTYSSEEHQKTRNRKQEEGGVDDPPRIPPKPGKEKGKREKDKEKEEEKEQGKGGRRRRRSEGRNRSRSGGPAHPRGANSKTSRAFSTNRANPVFSTNRANS